MDLIIVPCIFYLCSVLTLPTSDHCILSFDGHSKAWFVIHTPLAFSDIVLFVNLTSCYNFRSCWPSYMYFPLIRSQEWNITQVLSGISHPYQLYLYNIFWPLWFPEWLSTLLSWPHCSRYPSSQAMSLFIVGFLPCFLGSS